ncbi:MAG: 2-C-methyl-D-erythritol 4-phosphate cytidylyltransferase [Candidatus Nanopelagicales bacterium]
MRVEVAAIVAAAGSGERLGATIPKALVRLGDKALVAHAVHSLLATDLIDLVVVTAPPGHEEQIAAAVATVDHKAQVVVVPGGISRTESVAHGLAAIPSECEFVLVHDAARALAPVWLCAAVLAELEMGSRAVVPAIPVVDTIRELTSDGGSRTLERARLRAVQTPQGFHAETLRAAHRAGAGQDATDDAGLIEALGGEVSLITGSISALKVTTQLDLIVAEAIYAERVRTGANP